MERGVTNRSLIEYFLLMQDTGQNNKLIYYDQQGTRIEKPIEGGHIDEALKLFDGKPKAVGRSSGGVVRAIPYQLVLCEGAYGTVTPQPKIRVRFKEFKRDVKGHIIRGQYQNVAKVVEPNQIIDLFSYQLQGPQRFVVDFGRGIVPVYVFAYAVDKANRTEALIVELDDIEKAIIQRSYHGPNIGRTIQAYQISRDMLRFAGLNNGYGIDEYEVALHNYHHQKQTGLEVIPKTLACAPAFQGLTNLTYEGFRKMAVSLMSQTAGSRLSFLTPSLLEKGEENLVPFGEYEDNKE